MINKSIVIQTLCALPLALLAGRARFHVKVLDAETRLPVPNVSVRGYFQNYPIVSGRSGTTKWDNAVTDEKGSATLCGETTSGQVSWSVSKVEGYYPCFGPAPIFKSQNLFMLGLWQPSGQTVTALVQRVVSPVPLFVKWYHQCKLQKDPRQKRQKGEVVLSSDGTVQYDLMKGDWLPPNGKGEVADVLVKVTTEDLGEEQFDRERTFHKYREVIRIEFPGDGNGAVEFRPEPTQGIKLREAPEDGYGKSFVRWNGWFGMEGQYQSDFDDRRCYAFRIRTKKDKEGRIISSFYGKVYRDFNFFGNNDLGFIYYLNPVENSRNLEYDRKHNLNKCRWPDAGFFEP